MPPDENIPASAAVLSAEDLADLGESLRRQGFKIATQQCVWAQQLLVRVALAGRLPAQPRELTSLLGPIFCCTPEQQKRFPELFGEWLARRSDGPPAQVEREEKKTARDRQRPRHRSALILVAIVLAAALGAWIWNWMSHRDQSRQSTNPPAGTKQPTTDAVTTTTAPAANAAGGIEARLDLVLAAPPAPLPFPWPRLLLAVSPLVLFLLWLGWKRWRQRPVLQRSLSETPRNLKEVPLGGGVRHLLPGLGVRQLARELRRRRTVHSRELDVTSTISASLRHGGLFTPIFGSRVEPDYLVLIDRASFADHQARLADEIVRTLELGDVSVDRFYFDGDPRRCRRYAGAHMKGEQEIHGLDDLALRFPSHRLLLFSDGSSFFDGFTGEPAPWMALLDRWSEKAILTPEFPSHWGRREWAIERLGLVLLPLAGTGLATLAELFRDRPHVSLAAPEAETLATPLFARTPSRWLERQPPSEETRHRLCKELQAHLTDEGFQWLAACAAYPEIHWGLTLRLGAGLLPQQREFEKLLPRLARLIWMREGYMPDWFREELLGRLDPATQIQIGKRLEEMLAQAGSNANADITLQIGLVETGANPSWRDGILRWWRRLGPKAKFTDLVRSADPGSPLRDYVFLRFMSGRDFALTPAAPKGLLRFLFPQGIRLFGLRTTVVLAACLGVATAMALRIMATRTDPPAMGLTCVAFSSDGRWVAAGSSNNTAIVWEVGSGKVVTVLRHDAAASTNDALVSSVAFSPDGSILASGSGPAVSLWEPKTGKRIAVLQNNTLPVERLVFAPDGATLAVGYSSGEFKKWDVKSRALIFKSQLTENRQGVVLMWDGRDLVAVSREGEIFSATSSGVRTASTSETALRYWTHLAFSPDGSLLVAAFPDKSIRIYDRKARSVVATTKEDPGILNDLALSPDKSIFATAGFDGTVSLWRAMNGQMLSRLSTRTSSVDQVAFSPDGKTLAAASSDGTVHLWSLSTPAGQYSALLIGCDYRNEQGGSQLASSVRDVRAVGDLLRRRYGFTVTTIENPTHKDAMVAMEKIRPTIGREDTFLLMLSGRGYAENRRDFAFPFNSNMKDGSLTQSDLARYLSTLNARRALVIADADQAYLMISEWPPRANNEPERSRTVLAASSRGGSPPMDGGNDYSPFVSTLLQALQSSPDPVSGRQLLDLMNRRPDTTQGAPRQRPSYGPFLQAGHIGGDFQFPPPIAANNPPTRHTIDKGDSFNTLAKKYGISHRDIVEANPGLDSTRLKIGDIVMIPAPRTNLDSIEQNTTNAGLVYRVNSGDTVEKIANAHGITVRELRAANGLVTDQIKVGQELKIPPRRPGGLRLVPAE